MTAPNGPAITEYIVVLERACAALRSLIRSEYGDYYMLTQIAGPGVKDLTPEQVSALRVMENGSICEPLDELLHHIGQRSEVDPSQVGD
jgi:hypothetical protein